ncbi:hypothetical protein FGB62_120g126 [Gracilaria domingensis]|nr:hypothetical protein FGB62_120g126 [Gracilaria domingensis]
MVFLVDGHPRSEPMLSASIQCVSQLMTQGDASTKFAASYLRESFTKVLIENYLFRDMPITMRERLVHVVHFLDAIASTTEDAQIFETFLTTLIESAEKVGGKADRMVGILLLRCLTRCDEKVVSVALDKMTSFIGTNRHRKETFLPLVRAAVLGLDTAKKDVCVVWMMRLFGDMKQQQVQRTRPTAAVGTNMRTAKL